jgi:hypothetical protein
VTSVCQLLAPETVHPVDACGGALALGLQARGDEVP